MKRAPAGPLIVKRRFAPAHAAATRADDHNSDVRDVRQRLAAQEMELEASRATVRVKLEKIEREAQLSVDVQRRAGEAEALRRQLDDLKESLECAVCMERPATIALSCGHCYCCDAACVSAKVQACPTCQAPILTRTKLFGGNVRQTPASATAQPKPYVVPLACGAHELACGASSCSTTSLVHRLSSLAGTNLVCYFTGRRYRMCVCVYVYVYAYVYVYEHM